jgi:hypothetical protein
MTNPDPITLANEMLAGLEVVTPGPWEISRKLAWDYVKRENNRCGPIDQIGPAFAEEYAGSVWIDIPEKDAAHLARCSPNNIRALCEALIEADEENDRLVALLTELQHTPHEDFSP